MTQALAVLDTNVVLDWLVFRDHAVMPLALAIESGSVCWLGCAETRAELSRLLTADRFGAGRYDVKQAHTSVDQHCTMVELPRGLPLPRARCSDPDDQVFVDLALGRRARWLLTRDRALLKLARRCAPLGLLIQPPSAWRPD